MSEEVQSSAKIITELGKRFHARYAKTFASMNGKIIKSVDDGGYPVPRPVLSDGGFHEVVGDDPLPVPTGMAEKDEGQVAKVKAGVEKYKPLKTRYVVRVPWVHVEETFNNIEYFNLYFDSVVQQALNNYVKKYGSQNDPRYGECFVDYVSPSGEVFRYDGSGDHLDLYLEGKWASMEKA